MSLNNNIHKEITNYNFQKLKHLKFMLFNFLSLKFKYWEERKYFNINKIH